MTRIVLPQFGLCAVVSLLAMLMKTRLSLEGLVGFFVLAFVGSSLGQSEQWLQYRTMREPQGYHWLQLTNVAPAGVVWPKLGANAHYGTWKTPLDPKGERWICIDRTARSGPCDRIFIDSNGNGRLDDETPLKATRRDEYMAYFDPAKLVFKGEDGPLTYHLSCRFYQYETNQAQLLTGSGCVYEGKVNLGGKKRVLQLIDNTVNGTFNDIAANPYESDRVQIDGQQGTSRYLGRLLEVDGKLFEIEVARDGAFVKLRPAANLVFGTVKIPESISEFTAYGTNGHFIRKPAKGEFSLPAGSYIVQGWTIERNDASRAAWTMQGYGFGPLARFEATSAKPATLDMGEPVTTVLQATQNKTEISFSLRLQGKLGESVQIMRGQEQAPPPRLTLAQTDGKPLTVSSFQYG